MVGLHYYFLYKEFEFAFVGFVFFVSGVFVIAVYGRLTDFLLTSLGFLTGDITSGFFGDGLETPAIGLLGPSFTI